MAYCLGSLVEILDQMLRPDQYNKIWVLDHDKLPQVQSLSEKATVLLDFLSNSSPIIHSAIESLEDRIREAAENAEDILESHVASQIHSSPKGQTFTISPPDLDVVIQVFESAKEEMIQIRDARKLHNGKSQTPNQELPSVPSRSEMSPKDMVVGVKGDLNYLRGRLTGRSPELEIISVIGMGGTGKTTLARILYDEFSFTKFHFDICAWVTVSQDFDSRGILQSLLGSITGNSTHMDDINDLIVKIYQFLYSRRYFIVLDDVWGSEAWDAVQIAFPRDNNRSRIILTTRQNDLADYVKSKSHHMRFLSENDSWELLRKKVFGEESCPRELEEVGKRISKSCKGLPLAVEVIGGLLSKAERNKETWEEVASNVGSSISNADKQFSGIFSLSYASLPHYLKPCFLYIGSFPEDYKIPASKLMNLWAAEGFLHPLGDKDVRSTAKIYFNTLIDRNLIFVRERKENGEPKYFGIHDLLRDLCLSKAAEKIFVTVRPLPTNHIQDDSLCSRRISVYASDSWSEDIFRNVKLTTPIRSFRCIGHSNSIINSQLCFELSLLRVLDVLEVDLVEFPKEILKLVNLRYLAFCCWQQLPKNMCLLRSLQTLIVDLYALDDIVPEIFDLPELRHVKFFDTARASSYEEIDTSFTLHAKLQSLSLVPLSLVKRLLGKVPSLRKLGIRHDTPDVVDLTCFSKLETFKGYHNRPPYFSLSNLIFPDCIKKITVHGCFIEGTFMHTIGSLPNLETLKLRCCYLIDTTWEPIEGEFCMLQSLYLIGMSNLESWLAVEENFPALRHLVIKDCKALKEIPPDIGGIETLEIIEVDEISCMALDCARRILEEQLYLGNDTLQLRVL